MTNSGVLVDPARISSRCVPHAREAAPCAAPHPDGAVDRAAVDFLFANSSLRNSFRSDQLAGGAGKKSAAAATTTQLGKSAARTAFATPQGCGRGTADDILHSVSRPLQAVG